MKELFKTENLVKNFGSFTATNDVNLSIREGELHAIIGPNGAGKTTLFNLLTGAIKPTSGKILLRGEDITGLSPHEIAQKGVARSFQISNVFLGLTVFENVRISVQAKRGTASFSIFRKPKYLKDIVNRTWEILERTGLAKHASTSAELLSHGDTRRLELALVLGIEAPVILLDEPLAGMSPEESREAMELIKDISRDHSVVMVEHDMDMVFNNVDSITVLERGAILTTGTPDEIKNNEEVQKIYLGALH
ncbi:ABC transporter ATP-binding protein [Ferviditalea candida]|uniref:ABC transporter ATP-binding protein n=1 Tax=Ferviditalea candida TaxID=3108399 RepID=A0ABU5ZKF8_9BACL|nr:ABC transporter ATP-binding protein [Paenibacillaceae bacterium T2]